MGVDGYLEIYTTLFGWRFYNLLWDIFSQTGIIYLPLLGLLISNWKEPAESQDDKPAASTSLRRNSIQLPIMYAVFILGVVPVVQINLEWIKYTDECQDIDVNGERTNTTYDETLKHRVKDSDDIRIPIIWVLITKIGAGINTVIRSSTECISNLRDLDSMLRTLSIQDPVLRNEYDRFYSECYVPARIKLLDKSNRSWAKEQVDKFKEKYKTDIREYAKGLNINRYRNGINEVDDKLAQHAMNNDMNYLAPAIFLNTPGLFQECTDYNYCGDTIRASAEVDGWHFDSERDADYNPHQLNLVSQGKLSGRPTCREWWLGPNDDGNASVKIRRGPGLADRTDQKLSLLSKLVDHAKTLEGIQAQTRNLDKFVDSTSYNLETDNTEIYEGVKLDFKRQIVKAMMRNGPPRFTGGDWGVESNSDKIIVAGLALAGGKEVIAEGGKFYIALMFVKEVAPMVKALVLMVIYGLLIVYMLASKFTLESIIPAATLIISIQCWGGLWTWAEFIDENLFLAMYPNPNTIGGGSGFGSKRLLLDFLTTGLFILAPLVLSALLTLSGIRSAGSLDTLFSAGANGSRSLGGTVGRSGASKSVSGASKALNGSIRK